MSERSDFLRSIFTEALEIGDPERRETYLVRACGDDLTLRREVEELLQAEAQSGQFLPEQPGSHAIQKALAAAAVIPSAQAPRIAEPGERIGRYKLLQKIGEGGCGIVYMAEQQEPVRRKVALKVIKLGMDTRSVVARFEAERQALALMDHPNIARVLDAGATETGRPFFVMELVRGKRITQYCDEQKLSTRDRLDLFIQVCQAVQHAHQKGIIHRDLKPSNILVTERDGVHVPKVIDFGIAKATGDLRLTDKTIFTAFEQFVGTPAYMSPEQAQLSGLDIDTRSDIYSLGVLLYELLTGKTPFDAKRLVQAGLDEVRRIIRDEEPPRPSTRLSTLDGAEQTTVAQQRHSEPLKLLTALRGDIDWIVMKSLDKDRNRRYETALGLARDVQRHLEGEPVMARPPSRLYNFQKTVRRHKLGVAAATAVIITLAGAALVSTWQAVQKESERRRFKSSVVRQFVANGTRLVNDGDLFGSLLWYAEALRLDAGDPRREESHRVRIASVLRQCPKLVNVFSHGKMLYHAEFSPDGSKVLTTSDDHTARVWEATTGRRLLVLQHDGEVFNGAFSTDGTKIVTSSQDKTARVWNSQTGVLLYTLNHKDIVWCSCFSHDGRLVATACRDQTAQLWNALNGQRVGPPLEHGSAVENVNFSPDGRLLGTVTSNAVGRVWDVITGEERFHAVHSAGSFCGVGFDRDSRAFITCDDSDAHIWDAQTFKELTFSPLKLPSINSAHFGPDGSSIVATSDEFVAQVWDAGSGRSLFTPPVRHTGPILNAAISPDGRYFATAGQDTIAQIWRTTSGELAGPPLKFIIHVKYIGFNADGRRLLGNSCDQAARVWDLATSNPAGQAQSKASDERRVISPDGRYILLQGASNVVWVVDTATGRRVAGLPHMNGVTYASFSRDGKSVITASERYTPVSSMANDIFLWDAQTGRRLNAAPMGHPFMLLYAAFSPDDRRLLTCGFDFTARLWDAHTGRPLSDPLRHREQIRWGAFSPDGRSVVTASWDRTARVWDASNGNPLTPPLLHKATVTSASWSPDCRRLRTITQDDYLQIWDLATGEPLTAPLKIQNSSADLDLFDAAETSNIIQDLPRDDRPVADLVLLAQMLAVGRVDAGGNVVPLTLHELTDAWQILHEKYPKQFASTTGDIVSWHQHEARKSLVEGNAAAAIFHLDRALERTPDDPVLRQARFLAEARANRTQRVLNGTPPTPCPPRQPQAGSQLIDLSSWFNLSLSDSLGQKPDGNNFSSLGPGLHTLDGIKFDVRGLVHLSGQAVKREGQVFPERVDGILIGQKCRRLHFLQASSWESDPGTPVGSYVLHYADGEKRELPIVFGKDTANWWFSGVPVEASEPAGARVVWAGHNALSDRNNNAICLLKSTRDNPRPDVEVVSIDFVSSMSLAAPFLVALTVDNLARVPDRPDSTPARPDRLPSGEP